MIHQKKKIPLLAKVKVREQEINLSYQFIGKWEEEKLEKLMMPNDKGEDLSDSYLF